MLNISIYLKTSIALGLLLLMTGCLEVKQSIRLTAKGSLDFSLEYSVPEAYLPALARFHSSLAKWQESAEGASWLLDKAAVRQQFPEDTFTITRHTSFSKDGRRIVEIAGTAQQGDQALSSGALGSFSLAKTADGAQRIALQIPPVGQGGKLSAAEAAALEKAIRGFRLVLVIETPEAVKQTNGEKTGRKEVTWTFSPETLINPDSLPKELFATF